MKLFKYIIPGLLLLSVLQLPAGTNTTLLYHDTPQGVVRGDNVRIEVMLNTPGSQIYDMYLFYRQVGSNTTSGGHENEGFLYYASLNTRKSRPVDRILYRL
jgi:hypothetical protein